MGAVLGLPRLRHTSGDVRRFCYLCTVIKKTRDMVKSNIAVGQMFIQFPQPIAELQEAPKPRVWVKVKNEVLGNHYGEDSEETSLFIDNEALAKFSIGSIKQFGIRDKWHITDGYYGQCVREGKFVPVSDLNEVDGICLEMGYPPYEMDIF
jgi:hypothetical protein